MTITVTPFQLAFKALPDAVSGQVTRALALLDPGVSAGEFASRRFRRKGWMALADHFRFCVVRDPIQRLMSCYTEVLPHCTAEAPGDFPVQVDPDYFFTYLDDYRAQYPEIRRHAMGAAFFLGQDLTEHYDRVFPDTDLGALERVLTRRTGQVVRLPAAERPARRLSLDDLLDETIDVLRPFLDAEYEHLAGYFSNPLGARLHALPH